MSYIKWCDEYCIGVSLIDDQHKHLFKLVNDFQENINLNDDNSLLFKIMDDLVEYCLMHFEAEEELTDKYDYPEHKEHIDLHLALVEKVLKFRERIRINDDYIKSDLISFLRDWLINHILDEDMKIGKHILKQLELDCKSKN